MALMAAKSFYLLFETTKMLPPSRNFASNWKCELSDVRKYNLNKLYRAVTKCHLYKSNTDLAKWNCRMISQLPIRFHKNESHFFISFFGFLHVLHQSQGLRRVVPVGINWIEITKGIYANVRRRTGAPKKETHKV